MIGRRRRQPLAIEAAAPVMARKLVASGMICSLLLALAASSAVADELPIRKPGLWEVKIVRTGGAPISGMLTQQCTDESTDRLMNDSLAPMATQTCSKRDIRKTVTGYVSDAVCSGAGISIISHSEIVGDFNAFYTG